MTMTDVQHAPSDTDADRVTKQQAAATPVPAAMYRPWHARQSDRVLAETGAETGGLSSDEADARLERFGPNALPSS